PRAARRRVARIPPRGGPRPVPAGTRARHDARRPAVVAVAVGRRPHRSDQHAAADGAGRPGALDRARHQAAAARARAPGRGPRAGGGGRGAARTLARAAAVGHDPPPGRGPGRGGGRRKALAAPARPGLRDGRRMTYAYLVVARAAAAATSNGPSPDAAA